MKRYCQTLQLKDDPQLIADYIEAHRHVWPEIQAGIKEVGILDMQIYALGNSLFMIMDTTDEFDWERDNAHLAGLPRQAEWLRMMIRQIFKSSLQSVFPIINPVLCLGIGFF